MDVLCIGTNMSYTQMVRLNIFSSQFYLDIQHCSPAELFKTTYRILRLGYNYYQVLARSIFANK